MNRDRVIDDWFAVLVPAVVTFFFLVATSGQHFVDMVLFSRATLFPLVGIVAVCGVALLLSRLTGQAFSKCLAILALIISSVVLLLFTFGGHVLQKIGDAVAFVVIFCMAAECYCGIAFAVRQKQYAWLVLTLVGGAQFVYGFLLIFSISMAHWH
jgi:hypothetical protein